MNGWCSFFLIPVIKHYVNSCQIILQCSISLRFLKDPVDHLCLSTHSCFFSYTQVWLAVVCSYVNYVLQSYGGSALTRVRKCLWFLTLILLPWHSYQFLNEFCLSTIIENVCGVFCLYCMVLYQQYLMHVCGLCAAGGMVGLTSVEAGVDGKWPVAYLACHAGETWFLWLLLPQAHLL